MANVRIPDEGPMRPGAEDENGVTRRDAIRNGAKLVVGAGIGAQIMAATGAETAVAKQVRSVGGPRRGQARLRTARQDRADAASRRLPGLRVRQGRLTDERRPEDAEAPRRLGRLQGRHRSPDADPQPGERRPRQGARQAQRLRPSRQGRRDDLALRHAERRRSIGSGLVLNGTDNNCNGGQTPWGTWLTCEESTVGKHKGYEKEHGYVFEIPKDANGPIEPKPIKAMGRFVHEACAVDPRTGIVYMTEDNGPDGFYRYIPDHRGPAPPRRQAADALRQRPLASTTPSPARRSARSCAASG